MDLELIKQITTGIITFVAGYLLKNFEPKAKVLWWSTHAFRFNLPNPPHPNALVFTRSITIQNVGRRIAENIEISHASLPGFFKLQPALDYTPTETPTGEHIIRVATLGPRQFFTIEFISFNEAPVLSYVKSADGLAQPNRYSASTSLAEMVSNNDSSTRSRWTRSQRLLDCQGLLHNQCSNLKKAHP